jgi:hypothetical protein
VPEQEETHRSEITDEMIARRAFDLSQTDPGTDEENRHRAERELREEQRAAAGGA